jgi:hypothetical protein
MYILKFKFKCLDPDMNGSFQKRSTLLPRRKFLPSGGGGEKKMFLIIVSVFRAFFNIQAGGGGANAPQSPLVPPTKSHYFLGAQNAGNSLSRFQISKIFWGLSLISNDKLRLIFFFTFCAFFPSFISNTSIVNTNFRANLDAQNAGNGIPCFKFQKFSGGVHPTHVTIAILL